jgi:DNA-binding NarL/FixJ family response regulator
VMTADASPALSVIVAEDDFLVREGIRQVLNAGDGDFRITALCGDFDSVLAAVESAPPDVVVTDIRMPPTHTDEGIRIAAHLRSSSPRTGVVVLSQYAGPGYALRLLEKGSEGRAYLLKERIAHRIQLFGAIREVAQGGSVIDPKVVEALVSAQTQSANSTIALLTPRELEVLALMAQGRSNPSIAETLLLTKRGIEKHINAIYSKLDLPEETAVSRRVFATLMYLSDWQSAPTEPSFVAD